FRWVLHAEDPVELVIIRVSRREVGSAGGHMNIFAVAEPKLMYTARGRPGCIEKGDSLRVLRNGDVEELEPGRLQAWLLDLISHGHDVSGQLQRVGTHVLRWQIRLYDNFRITRVTDVNAGKVLWSAFVS